MPRTKNFSVRFDQEKLRFFQSKNPAVKQPQEIVDYFLDEYWWMHNGKRMGKSEVPALPETSKEVPQKQADETAQQRPKIRRSFDNYMALRLACENAEEWAILKLEIITDDYLTSKQKQLLTT